MKTGSQWEWFKVNEINESRHRQRKSTMVNDSQRRKTRAQSKREGRYSVQSDVLVCTSIK